MEQFKQVCTELSEQLDKLGLYTLDMHIVSNADDLSAENIDVKKLMLEESTGFAIVATFALSQKIAFSERVLNPDKFDDDKNFRLIAPTEDELIVSRFRELAEGVSEEDALLAMFDTEDDGDDS